MPKNVQLPDGRVVEFPDGMSDDQIASTIRSQMPPTPRFGSTAEKVFGKNPVSDTIGNVLEHAGNFIAGPYHAFADPVTEDEKRRDPYAETMLSDPISRGIYRMTVKPSADAIQDAVALRRKGGPQASITAPSTYNAQGENVPTAGSKLVDAIPVYGPWSRQYADEVHQKGVVPATAGLATDALTPFATAEAVKMTGRIPTATRMAKGRFSRVMYPENQSLTPAETASQEFAKSLKAPVKAFEHIKGATAEVPTVLDYAQRSGMPINGKLDFAKAAEGAASEAQKHFDERLLRPHSGKFQTVPEDYNGEFSGNGKTQASIGQINARVNEINSELKSTYRKSLASETNAAQASDAALKAEKAKLIDILHGKLAEMNGLQPEDIAGVRQRAGKMRTLAEETKLSANNDTLTTGRHDSGSAFSAFKKVSDAVGDLVSGSPEVVGNRLFKRSLEKYTPKYSPYPEPVMPDPQLVPTTPEAAQQEFLRSQALEQTAQDAAAARSAVAKEAREGNAASAYEVRTGRKSPTMQDRMDTTLTQPTPTAGASSPPIQLPASTSPTPDTHLFSRKAWLDRNPGGDLDAASDLAKQAGYDVQD